MFYLIVLLVLAACDLESSVESVPPAGCTKIGAQCQLPDEPLGVCQVAPCAEDKTPPCFACTPQH